MTVKRSCFYHDFRPFSPVQIGHYPEKGGQIGHYPEKGGQIYLEISYHNLYIVVIITILNGCYKLEEVVISTQDGNYNPLWWSN